MSLLSTSLDYTDKDFDSLRLRLQALIQSVFPDWTDYNVANFGNILVELMAFTGDFLSFYQDKQARESRITTATQRKNLVALVKLLNYKPTGAKAAKADVVLTLSRICSETFVLPAGTRTSTADIASPVDFQLLEDVTFAPGETERPGLVEHSETLVDLFTSNGFPNQSFPLPGNAYLDGSAIVTANDGEYVEQENFLNSTGSSRHYTLAVDQNDRATITFGNGVNGSIPVGSITVTSKVGGGAGGIVDAGTIRRVIGTFSSGGSPLTVTCTNPARSSGGMERQGIESIRQLAPEGLRAMTRSVAREDFEINARRVVGVARALMTTSNEDPAVAENRGILYVIPDGGGLPPQELKNRVATEVRVTRPPTLTFKVEISDPVYRDLNLNVVAYFRKGVYPPAGAAAIRAALQQFLAVSIVDSSGNEIPNPDVNFGYYYQDALGRPTGVLAFSDIFNVVRDVPLVQKLGGRPLDFLINGAHADVPIAAREFPRLGQVTIVNGDTGLLV